MNEPTRRKRLEWTGEFRKPLRGEYYILALSLEPIQAEGDFPENARRWILRAAEPQPFPAETRVELLRAELRQYKDLAKRVCDETRKLLEELEDAISE